MLALLCCHDALGSAQKKHKAAATIKTDATPPENAAISNPTAYIESGWFIGCLHWYLIPNQHRTMQRLNLGDA